MAHWYVGNLGVVTEVDELDGSEHQCWQAPSELMDVGGQLLDLRAMDTQDSLTVGGRQFGIVKSPIHVSAPQGWRKLGAGRLPGIVPNTLALNRLKTASGVNFTSTSLLGALREIFITNADRDGASLVKPMMPSRSRILKALQIKVNFNRPEFSSVLERLREDYRIVRNSSPKYRMWLANMLDRHGIRRRDYRHFQPSDLPDEEPEDPQTPITESFPGTSATLGGDLTWNEYDTGFQNVSGQAFKSGSAFGVARAETDLSGGDMYTQNEVDGGQNGWLGCAVRFSSSVETCYWSLTRRPSLTSQAARIAKRVTGTDTNLVNHLGSVHLYPAGVYNERLEVTGSDLELLADDETTSRLTVTDTAISSANIRAGVSGRDSGTNAYANDFEADILGGAGATLNSRMLLLGVGR